MVQKLFSYIDQTSIPDNPDSLQTQEVLLPGQLVTIYVKVVIIFIAKSAVARIYAFYMYSSVIICVCL